MDKELTIIALAQSLFVGNKIEFECDEDNTWWCNIEFSEKESVQEDHEKLNLLSEVSMKSNSNIQFNLGTKK